MTSKTNDLTDLMISFLVICFILIKFDHPSNPRPLPYFRTLLGNLWHFYELFRRWFGRLWTWFKRRCAANLAFLISILCFWIRASNRMSWEESAIFFINLAYIPHSGTVNKKHWQLFSDFWRSLFPILAVFYYYLLANLTNCWPLSLTIANIVYERH